MSEQNQAAEESQTEVEQPEVTPEMVSALAQRVEQLEASKNRILEESKEWKAKAQNLKAEREATERESLEKSGEIEKLLELERNRVHELTQSQNQMQKAALKKELSYQAARFAGDAYDVDDVIKSLPAELISLDKENLSVQGVRDAVTKLRETKPYLFKKNPNSGMADGRPSSQVPQKKNYHELSQAEKDAELVELFKQV